MEVEAVVGAVVEGTHQEVAAEAIPLEAAVAVEAVVAEVGVLLEVATISEGVVEASALLVGVVGMEAVDMGVALTLSPLLKRQLLLLPAHGEFQLRCFKI